jgi:aspartate racemase
MKTIGLIGGLSWVSTVEYYRLLNEMINARLGDLHSAKILLYSVDFNEIRDLTFQGDWKGIADRMGAIAGNLEKAGADCLLLGANTMHKIAADVQSRIGIPLLHIADAAGAAINKMNLSSVALLGTRYTMEDGFYQASLSGMGIKTLVPEEADRDFVHDAIYRELGKNIFRPETKARMIGIISKMTGQGAQGIVLGCTEIPMLIKPADCTTILIDTMQVHAAAAVEFALQEG